MKLSNITHTPMKLLLLLSSALITFSASALQIIIDDWAEDNQWTDKASNGASAQFYTSQTFSDADTSILFEAGGNSASDGRDNFYQYKPSSDGFDGWGTQIASYNAWDRSLDTSLGAPINGNDQLLKFGNSANQNRFDFQIENTGTETISLDSIGIMARNNFGANHPTTFTISHLQKGTTQGAVYLNELEINGTQAISPQAGSTISTSQIGDSIIYTGNQAKWVEKTFTGATLAAGAKASFRLEMSGNKVGGTGTAQTHFDTLTINVSAVPEPSTYALLAGFAVFLFVAIKRRK
jgi:hypothetical protein